MEKSEVDLLVVGAGPTGIALGAEARRAGLEVLIVDRGALTANLLNFPTYMNFFTSSDQLEVAGLPFTVPEEKPSLQQTLVYYRAVVEYFGIPLALFEEVESIERATDGFTVHSRGKDGIKKRRARAVALATGYFANPKHLGVDGEDLSWVHSRYRDPYRDFGRRVVIVGGGNSAAEAALELWRAGVEVAMVVRAEGFKPTVKYWVKPDIENRVAEGSIGALFRCEVVRFEEGGVVVRREGGEERVPADTAYVLIGYLPDAGFERAVGVEVDTETLVPRFDPDTCESNVPGLYLAGTIQAGSNTGRIFIDNSRNHSKLIVRHLATRLGKELPTASGVLG
ncbi:MAG TPA: YpdA family putative bacillithiol disulfide reductase [Thermoanaerobaculia bacterium]|nr:YpdA family putative bacillithiol disulfide reductase [Thermoanaerobaculia bacterium]